MHRTTHLTIEQGVTAARSIAAGLQAVMAPLPAGIAGEIAWARQAWRHDDRTFMSYDDEERIQIERQERMARGGR
jgi:hypothetical protein